MVDVDVRRDLVFVREICLAWDPELVTTLRKAVFRGLLGECVGAKQDSQRNRLH